jgi:hypothetical protein
MPQCDGSEKILDSEEEDTLIEEGCEVVLGRRPNNWKEEVQVLVYWATQLCPYTHLITLPDLVKRAGFVHLEPNLIRTVGILASKDELVKCIDDEDCEKAKELSQRYNFSTTLPASSLN